MGEESRIPDIMRYMMYHNSYGETERARIQFNRLPEQARKGLALKDYAQAEALCPQHVPIGQAMKEAARILG
jgi:predicted aldo/keto reductase-like oxidoreductase